jgi:hypothetical protein
MMPTPRELEADMKKVKDMVIIVAFIAFGAGFIAGAVLI